MAKTLFVRVQPKSGQKTFFRCGIQFSQDWLPVYDVDAATAKRLKEEQMLEVSETRPAELENETLNAADPAGGSSAGSASDAPAAAPEDQTERYAAIKTAIAALDKADATAWTKGGSPNTKALEALTGWPVNAIDRDAVWAEINAQAAQ
ncbi:hypothetical protein SKTS_33150 [Sulfurimicrobium lacus]|uniref:Mu-like prophage FluMu N-terminal domain-containing protein n=1 Tax=Sulfurimicrobium lacus TaxID=2715678 RepID=A0A6F8VI91_9PROT|nr:hypothetical protein [Sulfurimicrobium lacus]BCB28429.1 hypothetical protein SKTS_33150 [Sulfurimicrobium lacus]